MFHELKFRRFAGIAGLASSALGLVCLGGLITNWKWLEIAQSDRGQIDAGASLGFLFAGIALWLQRNGGHRRLAVVCAVIVLAAIIPNLAESLLGQAHGGNVLRPALGLNSQADAPLGSLRQQTSVALLATALALLLLPHSQNRSRRPTAIWPALFVLAIAGGNLFVSAIHAASRLSAPDHISEIIAAGLLTLGVGLVCARPDQQIVRLLAGDTALGSLARRLLLAVLVVPATLSALLLVLLGRAEFDGSNGVTPITMGFILLGLIMIVLSAETALKMDAAREAAVQQEIRLTAQLQEQAARLQETVGMRTYELHAAAEASARLALVAKHTTNAVIITDSDGRVEWVNPSFEGLSGYSLQEMIGQKPGPILQGPDTNPAAAAELSQALRNGTPCSVEILNYAKGGRPYLQLVSIQPVRDQAGRIMNFISIQVDVSALRRNEERMRQAEELLAESSRLAQVGGWEIDPATSRVTWSGETWRIHETEADFQPTLDTFFDFFPLEVRTAIEAALQGTGASEIMDSKVPLITAKGRHRWVRLIGRTDFSDGHPVRIHGAIQDVTAIHESHEAQRRLESQLFQTQKIDTMGTLAGGIAHDFNNLLTGILGYQELMTEVLEEGHPARAFLDEAHNASLRARNLVEQILAFSRQSDHAEHSPVDLQPLIEDAHRFLRATIPAQISIETEYDPTCGQVLADATQIHQILMNLGSNAAHAMLPEGGIIRIGLRAVRLQIGRDATFLGVPEGDYARLSFSDSGHGMDPTTQQRIFDPFFTTKKAGAGTGLGLSVVHGIVRAHHGAISVESTPGVGTTFLIHFPLCPSTDTQIAAAETPPPPRGSGELVCVVDDEAIVGRFTQLALENLGYRAMAFSSAQAAMDSLRSDSTGCALLLTDQTMPGIQGHELAMAVRQLVPNLPIIIMSGYFSRLAPQMLAPIGRVELLGKPFTGEELAHAMHRALHPPPAPPGDVSSTDPASTPA